VNWENILSDRNELAVHLADEGDVLDDSPWYRNPNNSGYSPSCRACVAGMAHTDVDHDAAVRTVRVK